MRSRAYDNDIAYVESGCPDVWHLSRFPLPVGPVIFPLAVWQFPVAAFSPWPTMSQRILAGEREWIVMHSRFAAVATTDAWISALATGLPLPRGNIYTSNRPARALVKA